MIVTVTIGTSDGSRPDWFVGLDGRLPVPLLRFLADTRQADLGPVLVAAMEIACRRTTAPAQGDEDPHPSYAPRRAGRRAVVESAVLPPDVGSRFLLELRELISGDARRHDGVRERLRACLADGPGDTRRLGTILAEDLAAPLGLTPTVCRAAVAVALTVIDARGCDGWSRPSQSSQQVPRQQRSRIRNDDTGAFALMVGVAAG